MQKRIAIATLATLVLSTTAWAQTEPLIGTWKLNLSKSKYDPGPPPQSSLNKYESAPSGQDGIVLTVDSVNARGERSQGQPSTYLFDGKEYAVTGQAAYDAVIQKRVDRHTTLRMQMKAGKLVNFLWRAVSPDGKTMTLKQIGIDEQGKPYSNIQIYDKQ